MLTIWVSDYVPNSIGYALFRQNTFRYGLTRRDLPDQFKSCLNTTCSAEALCLGSILPELPDKYPDASVEVEMATSKEPTTIISSDALKVTFSGVVTFQIRLSNGSVVVFLKINVKVGVFGVVTLTSGVLRGSVTRFDPTAEVVSSSLDSISSDLLSKAIKMLGDAFIVPKLNEKGQDGIPIPVLKGVTFSETHLEMHNHCFRISTDVQAS